MSWWETLFRKRERDTELNTEVHFHIAELTEENIAAGMPPEEARRQAALAFGGAEQIKEDLREVYKIKFIDSALANLKSAFRFVRKSPSFSITIILTLALGIGANSAVFSAIDAILLRPLPFPDGDRLMSVIQYDQKAAGPPTFVAPIRLEDWNRLNSTFQAITGYYTEDVSETSGALPEKITQAYIATRFLQVWGVSPALGRDFTFEEERFGGPSVVLISDRYWRRRFGGDPNAIGGKLRVGTSSLMIVGIMPASFLFAGRDVDIWSPIQMGGGYSVNRDATWFTVIGRLKQGVTLLQAQANMATVQAQLGRQYPKPDADLGVRIQPLKETTIAESRSSLWTLFGSVSLLLLIACTNIVALLLARSTQRQHEITVRFSLGASRTALVAQLLTEALVLSLAGGALGLIVESQASRLFRSLAANLPRVEEIRLDGRIVIYTLLCSVGATLLCGLLPAIRSTRRNISGSLAQASRAQVSGRHPLQWLLVGVQVTLAVTLLCGAGLLVRSFQALGRVTPGFEASHILTARISASWGESMDMKGLKQRIQRTIDTLRSLPGVEEAATSANLPGVAGKYQVEMRFSEGQQDPERKILAENRFVSPGYFATLRIPLLSGEMCREDPNSLHIVVNRSFASTYLADSTAIGRHIQVVDSMFLSVGEIRGIVGDAREVGLNHEPVPTVYWCLSAPIPAPFYLVRTRTEPMAMAETIRQKIHEVEPARSVFDIIPLEEHLGESFTENRLRTVLLVFFATTAVCLACIGLYGTLSYSVNTRRREIGLRMALGALRGQIAGQFLFQGMAIVFLGCLAGWGLATAFTRVLAEMLYGVSPTDFPTLLTVVLLVLMVGALASLLPAIRAARVDPMQVLREE
jgi:putative ABC transport system permease protein